MSNAMCQEGTGAGRIGAQKAINGTGVILTTNNNRVGCFLYHPTVLPTSPSMHTGASDGNNNI